MKMKVIAVLAALCLIGGCATGVKKEWNNDFRGDGSLQIVYVEAAVVGNETGGDAKLPIDMTVKIAEALKSLGLGSPELEVLESVVAPKPKTKPTVKPKEPVKVIVTGSDRHHHTTWASSDKGKSIVLCPGDSTQFDECHVGSVDIPFHGYDTERKIWWNMWEEPAGDIECTLGDTKYTFKSDQAVNYGNCR